MITQRTGSWPRDLFIQCGRIIDPSQGIDAVGDLFITEGKIGWIGTQQLSPTEHYDLLYARGMVVCPGFIDLHCHLRQPGFEDKETIASGSRAAARGGFTTICCMPNTEPPIDTVATVEYIKDIAAKESVVRVLPIGCITKGRKGSELAELGELASSGVVAFSDDGQPVADPGLMRRALEYSRSLDLPISDHCEDLALTQGGVMNEGPVAARLGLKGISPVSEERIVAQDIDLARSTGGRLHIAHVSTAGSVNLLRKAKEEDVAVTAEVTPHHLTLTEDMALGYNTNAKVNPPLRTYEDLEALLCGLKEGVLDAIATDHAPHTLKDKRCEFNNAAFGISGFETALGSLMGLVHKGALDLVMLISKLTSEPAKIIKSSTLRLRSGQALGTLKPGAPADVVIFDPEREWAVDPEDFASKGKNTPLAGRVLKGKVLATVVGGKIVYRDESIVLETIGKRMGVSGG